MAAKKKTTKTVEYRHEYMSPSFSDGEWHQHGLCFDTRAAAAKSRSYAEEEFPRNKQRVVKVTTTVVEEVLP